MGEPAKVVLLEKVIEVIKRDKLLENVQAAGNHLDTLIFIVLRNFLLQVTS